MSTLLDRKLDTGDKEIKTVPPCIVLNRVPVSLFAGSRPIVTFFLPPNNEKQKTFSTKKKYLNNILMLIYPQILGKTFSFIESLFSVSQL